MNSTLSKHNVSCHEKDSLSCDSTFSCQYDNKSLGRSSSLSLYNLPEGNSLAATESVRLLEVSGSVTAKQTNGTRENTQSLGSNSKV